DVGAEVRRGQAAEPRPVGQDRQGARAQHVPRYHFVEPGARSWYRRPGMIGRARELSTVLELVDAMCARRHTRNVVFVTGEAGAGKTTLLRNVSERLGETRPDVLAVATECSTPLMGQDVGQAEALEPWAELLEDMLRAGSDGRDGTTARRDQMIKLVSSVAIAWTHAVPVVGGVLHSSIETAVKVREHRQREAQQEEAARQEQMFQQYINF